MGEAVHPVVAIVAAGDRGAARAIHGANKVYLRIGSLPMVAHVVRALQDVPEVSEVLVIGDTARLAETLGDPAFRPLIRKPLHLVPQQNTLYENAWYSFRSVIPGVVEADREPAGDELDTRVLYVSGDIPFGTANEISLFVRRGFARGVDYALGLVTEESMQSFAPAAPGDPGIRMVCFNTREGRFRQSNLHLVKPGRLRNRHYIEEMYRHRYQQQIGPIIALAWRLLRSEQGGFAIVAYYALMHLAALADRRGWRRLSDWLRWTIPISRIERAISGLLGTTFAFVATEIGGCAIDIDNEADYEAATRCFERWRLEQALRAERVTSSRDGIAATSEPGVHA